MRTPDVCRNVPQGQVKITRTENMIKYKITICLFDDQNIKDKAKEVLGLAWINQASAWKKNGYRLSPPRCFGKLKRSNVAFLRCFRIYWISDLSLFQNENLPTYHLAGSKPLAGNDFMS